SLATGYSDIHAAGSAVAGNDPRPIGAHSIRHRVPPPVQPQSTALLRRSVAAIAVGSKQRLDIPRIVDPDSDLGRQSLSAKNDPDNCACQTGSSHNCSRGMTNSNNEGSRSNNKRRVTARQAATDSAVEPGSRKVPVVLKPWSDR